MLSHIQLEKKAARAVLDNISRSYRSHGALVSRIRSFTEDSGRELNFAGFLDWYHLTPGDIYGKDVTFARLCVEAGVRQDFAEETEALLSRVMYRFAAFDSRRRIAFLLDILPRLDNVDFAALPPLERRMLQMFHMTVWDCWAEDWNGDEVLGHLYSLADSPVMPEELLTLLRYQYDRIDFIDSTTGL